MTSEQSALQSVNVTGSAQKLVAMTGQYRSTGSPATGEMRIIGAGSTVTISSGASVNFGLLSGTITNTVTIDDGLLQTRTKTAAITPRSVFLPLATKIYNAGW